MSEEGIVEQIIEVISDFHRSNLKTKLYRGSNKEIASFDFLPFRLFSSIVKLFKKRIVVVRCFCLSFSFDFLFIFNNNKYIRVPH